LTPAESPFVPSGSGGSISLAAGIAPSLVASSLGISTIGNIRNEALPLGSATLFVAADRDIDLGGRGSIETYQGSAIQVTSVSGALRAGVPPPGFTGRRGIVTLFRDPGFGSKPAQPIGGGPISVDVENDFDIGGLALAALSGNGIAIVSREASIDAGVSTPFSAPSVFVDGTGTVNVTYTGGGIFAANGNIDLIAKQDIRIGAGITGQTVNIDAGGNLVASNTGGGVHAQDINANVGGSIGGTLSATGSINISGGTVQGASLSAGGIVSGAGAGVGSNAGAGKSSSELGDLAGRGDQVAAAGLETARKGAMARHGVVIKVTSRVIN